MGMLSARTLSEHVEVSTANFVCHRDFHAFVCGSIVAVEENYEMAYLLVLHITNISKA